VGAAAGAALGYFAFFWIAHQGFYALVLPGALLGLGACLARSRSVAVSIACGVAAVALGLFAEWRFEPFIKDAGLGYFLTHLHQLKGLTLISIAAGGVIAFWVPFRSQGGRTEA
jgi:hypothetical protein